MTDVATLLPLLDRVWPKLSGAIDRARALGADWSSISRAFVREIDGVVAAHAGVLEIPLVIDAVPLRCAGIHAVCTAAAHRGRGLARAVLSDAIDHASAWAPTLLLHAADPALYTRFGFRAIDQFAWTCEVSGPRAPTRMRHLADTDARDVARVHRAFEARTPVSHVLGVGDAAGLFVLDEVLACGRFARLWAIDALDLVIACELDERVLRIYDVVGPSWPELWDVVAHAPGRVDRVEIFFTPDRWPQVRWQRRPCATPDVLMVRGEFTQTPITMPPLARC